MALDQSEPFGFAKRGEHAHVWPAWRTARTRVEREDVRHEARDRQMRFGASCELTSDENSILVTMTRKAVFQLDPHALHR